MPKADESRKRTTLAELKEFLSFLQSLWGVLAGVTVLFPLSNSLMAVLPLLPGWETLSTVLATLFSAFALFVVFALRHFVDDYEDAGMAFLASLYVFSAGAAALVVYLYIRLEPLAVGFVPVLYAIVFGLFTAAFALLALTEYVREDVRRGNEKGVGGAVNDDDLDELLRG